MSWFYVEGGASKGPLEDDDFQRLVQAGTVRPETLVWREGMPDWQPHARVLDPNAVVPGMPPPLAAADVGRCAECGRTFERRDMVAYSGALVCAGCRDVFFQKVREGLVVPGRLDVRGNYAGFWIRLGAFVIDSIALGMAASVVNIPLMLVAMPSMESATRANEFPATFLGIYLFMMFFGFALQISYRGVMIGRYGATLGKLAVGVRVVRADGSKVAYSRAFGRAAAEVVSGMLIYIGYIIAAFDDQKRALHDHMCDTRVIKKT